MAWFKSKATAGVKIDDRSDETYMIAVQGPRAIELLDAVATEPVSAAGRFDWCRTEIGGVPILFGRTGYTGEDGGELFFPAEKALFLWEYFKKGKRGGIETRPSGSPPGTACASRRGCPFTGMR